jgi:hypothetical protein
MSHASVRGVYRFGRNIPEVESFKAQCIRAEKIRAHVVGVQEVVPSPRSYQRSSQALHGCG